MATYEKGDSDEEIERIQKKLGIEADGDFGSRTVAAVKAWQKANGQKADGMVGPDMLLALGLTELIILENGDEGDLVRRVQSALGVAVDGDYGDDTEDAVRAYQKANRLRANGSADLKTLRALNVLEAGGRAAPAPAPAAPAHARPAPIATAPSQSTTAAPAAKAGSASIATWAYQLSDIDPKTIAALPVDLMVIDYSADGEDATAFKAADTQRMKQKPGGGHKKLISYVSIGEAEEYRYYWQDAWKQSATRPQWLDDENPDWEGNYKVRFWDPAWQAIILGSPQSYLDRIIAAGFDGVYLDIIDAFEYWRDEKGERPEADRDMIAFVARIAAYARKKRSDFLIIPQNGEALLSDPAYRAAISAQAKEDIFYGIDGDGRVNKKDAVAECVACLAHARDAGLPILAVEYLKDAAKIADARAKLSGIGCVSYFGPRDLDAVNTKQFKS